MCIACDKKKELSLNKINQINSDRSNQNLDKLKETGEAVFKGRFGRFLYFLLLLTVALTPIINLVMAYIFYRAIYGGRKPKIINEQNDKDTNATE